MHLNLKQRAIIEIELESISNSIMKIAKNDSGNIKYPHPLLYKINP